MDKQKVDLYLTTNAKYFETSAIPLLRQKLENASDDSFVAVQSVELKDPTMILIVSVLLGSLGIDRFMLGDIGMGILKLFTCGLCGILTIIDWFTVQKRARQANMAAISMVL